jgi:hypothetical protein
MTLSGPECDQVSSTLRLQARSIEGAALTRRDTLLSVPPSLFPGSEEEYSQMETMHMAEHMGLQEMSEELMQQRIVRKQPQQQQLVQVQVQEEEEEGDDANMEEEGHERQQERASAWRQGQRSRCSKYCQIM